jgi:hypothetical protein
VLYILNRHTLSSKETLKLSSSNSSIHSKRKNMLVFDRSSDHDEKEVDPSIWIIQMKSHWLQLHYFLTSPVFLHQYWPTKSFQYRCPRPRLLKPRLLTCLLRTSRSSPSILETTCKKLSKSTFSAARRTVFRCLRSTKTSELW